MQQQMTRWAGFLEIGMPAAEKDLAIIIIILLFLLLLFTIIILLLLLLCSFIRPSSITLPSVFGRCSTVCKNIG